MGWDESFGIGLFNALVIVDIWGEDEPVSFQLHDPDFFSEGLGEVRKVGRGQDVLLYGHMLVRSEVPYLLEETLVGHDQILLRVIVEDPNLLVQLQLKEPVIGVLVGRNFKVEGGQLKVFEAFFPLWVFSHLSPEFEEASGFKVD